jgi:hypothetical protein
VIIFQAWCTVLLPVLYKWSSTFCAIQYIRCSIFFKYSRVWSIVLWKAAHDGALHFAYRYAYKLNQTKLWGMWKTEIFKSCTLMILLHFSISSKRCMVFCAVLYIRMFLKDCTDGWNILCAAPNKRLHWIFWNSV